MFWAELCLFNTFFCQVSLRQYIIPKAVSGFYIQYKYADTFIMHFILLYHNVSNKLHHSSFTTRIKLVSIDVDDIFVSSKIYSRRYYTNFSLPFLPSHKFALPVSNLESRTFPPHSSNHLFNFYQLKFRKYFPYPCWQ